MRLSNGDSVRPVPSLTVEDRCGVWLWQGVVREGTPAVLKAPSVAEDQRDGTGPVGGSPWPPWVVMLHKPAEVNQRGRFGENRIWVNRV